jgi:glycosyltransferase involved in cell wall biosynthesis
MVKQLDRVAEDGGRGLMRARAQLTPAPRSKVAQNALVVAPQPFFTPRGTPFSVYYRTLVAAEQGVLIDLLTYGEGEDVAIPGVRIIRIPRFRFLGPVPVGPSPTKLFLDLWLVLWTVGLLLRRRYDFVHAHEEAVFWCRFLKPLFGFRLAYDMHSSLPQQLANFHFTNSRLLTRTFSLLEKSALAHSDAVITICPDLEAYALAQGVSPDRQFLIENSLFDNVRLANTPRTTVAAAEETPVVPPDAPTIVYAGTFEPYQGLDLLLQAFARVRRQRPEVHLLLIGGTPEQVRSMRDLAEQQGIAAACTFTGRLPKERTRRLLEQASVLVSPRVEGTNTPLKIYEQLASGKPLVATRIYSHTQVLTEEVCFLVEPDPDAFAEGLLDALDAPAESRRRAQNARQLYETAYARHCYEDKMRRFLEVLR